MLILTRLFCLPKKQVSKAPYLLLNRLFKENYFYFNQMKKESAASKKVIFIFT
jgi:hypothetical protein